MGCIRIVATILLSLFFAEVHAATYYLDAVDGLDSQDGSSGLPWQTLSKAQSVVVSGDVVYIRAGSYGAYTEANVTRSSYITYEAIESAVEFTQVDINNTSLRATYLYFSGITIQSAWVDPDGGEPGADDPQYANSDQGTYAKALSPVTIDYAQYIKFEGCDIKGTNKHLTLETFLIQDSADVTIESTEMSLANRGITFMSSSDVSILYNHIHSITSSAIGHGNASNTNTLIEGNHAHDANYSESEDYAPRATGAEYHGSAVAIRNGTTTVKNNVFHDGFPSSGIMTYGVDATGTPHHDNITIENNLLYDIHNVYVIRFYLLGDNVVVRNNTLISTWQDVNDGRYQYNTALAVHTLDTDGTPSLTASNNIAIGIFSVGDYSANVTQKNNVLWSFARGTVFYCEGSTEADASNIVMTCEYGSSPEAEVTDLFNGTGLVFTENHGLYQDFTLSGNSLAINFGNSSLQSTEGLGSLDANKGFVLDNGITRTSSLHSGGVYEVGSSSFEATNISTASFR